ncbi:TLR4 interactor with leucine rich repeats [Austrofundulus limnaeus]|uniref:TLR4 interactor with leucine rich repeats n=1 Tax=Austrofundulus limnaeus TaxID=52670 RepID=A0A2I4BFY1_AUSLI|nr:PREDICTED: TLR4 interactor with leucine rich repeats [Austrofundulus limnaeus]
MDTRRVLLGLCFFLLLPPSVSPVTDFCPERCDCAHPQQLLCANRGLRAVSKPAPSSDDALIFNLAGNFIANISASDFSRYGRLIRLNLQFNQISDIHPKAFEKLSQLEELFLGHNLLTDVAAGTLQPLRKLAVLYGNNNALKKITPEIFCNLENLVKLRLDGNSIDVLQDSVFRSLTSLHYLHLEHNKVQHVHRDAFSKLSQLRFLNLAHNKQSAVTNVLTFSQLRALTTLLLSENEIQHVGNHVFQNLKRLTKLSLSNNRISRLDSEALKGLSSLRELLIDGNKLEEVPTGLLDPLVRIERLDFSRNRIANVNSSAFSKLKYLKVLKLSNNVLTSLSGGIFALNNVLYDLDLRGNNWTCDCRLEELKRWMITAHSRGKLLAASVQCHHPVTLRGKYLDYVNSSQLQPRGNWSHSCTSGAGPEESRGGGVLVKVEAEKRGALYPLDDEEKTGERNRTEGLGQGSRGGTMRREGEKRKRAGQDIQEDQEGAKPLSFLKEAKTEHRSAESAAKRPKGRRRSKIPAKTNPSTTSNPSHETSMWSSTSSPVQSKEKFDLLRSAQEEALPVITDPCVFNRHFITNVSVDEVTSTTVTVYWTTRAHHRYTSGPRMALHEVHFRILFDRFGNPDRFPRYVYAPGSSRAVTLRELTPGVTYMVCVEGVVGGSVCQVAPRDHCGGLVTLPEEEGRSNATLTSDLQLVTVATLVGNGVLLLVITGVWVGRSLRRRLQKRKSAVHVRHMYSTRRPFRPGMASTSMSTDFTSYQSSRPSRLAPLEEGDLIEFPCDRFLDSCGARRDGSMQRFSD